MAELKNVGILVDTSAGDFPEVFEGTNVQLIPLHIVFPDGTDVQDTPENVIKTNLYERIKNGEDVKTSQASPGELMIKYEDMLNKYDHIIHLPIPDNLSSMFQTSVMVSNDDDFAGKVSVIKHSLAASAIREAAKDLDKLIQSGKIKNIKDAEDFIADYEQTSWVGFIPGDLKKLAKGGRALKVIQTVLNIFKTKVLIKWEASPKKETFGRTIGSVMKTAVKLTKDADDNEHIHIFLDTPLTDPKISEMAEDILKDAGIKYTKETVPALYTTHAGVDSIAYIVLKKY